MPQFEKLLECNVGTLENLGTLCDVVAASLAAGAIDKAIMDYLLSASRPRVDGHAVLSTTGLSWVYP